MDDPQLLDAFRMLRRAEELEAGAPPTPEDVEAVLKGVEWLEAWVAELENAQRN